ncbi:hypothetical protein OPV22_006134 [Ensete ventricosum]|uniref:Uncharacterized protein n=1 Tax=Ensete ventricosum TaxID=4639 RepID=A0AAV8RKP3_ENSVE|nr:hypothetical protein OPV22_006133 [Ensete ventricosum]KAJ8505248.1 hypothetical protein OPV22_006134 [Ensete ventricosum]RWW03812.1 hypothetical protein GW17_00033006 [Ensete ventricosum]RZR95635.1 hypothetical protein BHM03_00024491 [Ensete ventricosum]
MASESWLVERAREELEKLESLHPTRFKHLKLELKSLISQPNSYVVAVEEDSSSPSPAPTQVSSNRKRKTGWGDNDEDEQAEQRQKKPLSASGRRGGRGGCMKSESSVEMAMRRAEACLRRIQQLKHNLFC